MKSAFLGDLFLISFLLFVSGSSGGVTKAQVLQYFSSISGKSTISGEHNREPNSDPTKWTRVVHDITGKYPGLWGGDFLYSNDDVNNRPTMIKEAIAQWNAGSVVALTWHVCPPTVGETCNWDQDINSHFNDDQWNQITQDGSQLNQAWKTRIDTVVPFFKQLDNAGVITMFRPLHEMNDGWSWWGGRSGSSGSLKLFQITKDYMTQHHGLNNIIWVWCVKDMNMGSVNQFWPGPNYVDVAALDIWENKYSRDEDYQTMLQVAGGKPIALGEVGAVPPPDLLAKQNQWIWFMVWAEYLKNSGFNNDNSVKQTYYDSRVLNQGNINIGGGGGGGGDNFALNRPIKSSSQDDGSRGPEKAVDGSMSTRWSSGYSDNQWISMDLGATKTIRTVTLYWEAAYAKGYQIQTSMDRSSWQTVYSNYNGDGGVDTITLSQPVSARYVKMYAFQRATQYGYSLFEFEVRG